MLERESKDWETTYQRKRKQSGEIPLSVLSEWENCPRRLIRYSRKNLRMSFYGSSRGRPQMGRLAKFYPKHINLVNRRANWVRIKNQNARSVWRETLGAKRLCFFSNEEWALEGCALFMSHSGNINRDLRICQPAFLETQNGFFIQDPDFWPIASKMVTVLIERANFLENHTVLDPVV